MAKPPGPSTLSPEAAAAMAVNERLFAAGLLDDFDAAAAARDKSGLRSLLAAVHGPDPDMAAIVRTVLNRPAGQSARRPLGRSANRPVR